MLTIRMISLVIYQKTGFLASKAAFIRLAEVKDCLINHILYARTDIGLDKFIATVRKYPVRQKYIDKVEFRIHPQACPRKSGVAKGLWRRIP